MNDINEVYKQMYLAKARYKRAVKAERLEKAAEEQKILKELKMAYTMCLAEGQELDARSKKKKPEKKRGFGIYVNEMSRVSKHVPTAYQYIQIDGAHTTTGLYNNHQSELSGGGYRVSITQKGGGRKW